MSDLKTKKEIINSEIDKIKNIIRSNIDWSIKNMDVADSASEVTKLSAQLIELLKFESDINRIEIENPYECEFCKDRYSRELDAKICLSAHKRSR